MNEFFQLMTDWLTDWTYEWTLTGRIREVSTWVRLESNWLQPSSFAEKQNQVFWLTRAESLSRVQLYGTPWTVTQQAPLSMGILQARILEWVAFPSSRGSSWPRNWTGVSCIAGGFFTSWAAKETIVKPRNCHTTRKKQGQDDYSAFRPLSPVPCHIHGFILEKEIMRCISYHSNFYFIYRRWL